MATKKWTAILSVAGGMVALMAISASGYSVESGEGESVWTRDGHDPYADFPTNVTDEELLRLEPDEDSEYTTELGDLAVDGDLTVDEDEREAGLKVVSGGPG